MSGEQNSTLYAYYASDDPYEMLHNETIYAVINGERQELPYITNSSSSAVPYQLRLENTYHFNTENLYWVPEDKLGIEWIPYITGNLGAELTSDQNDTCWLVYRINHTDHIIKKVDVIINQTADEVYRLGTSDSASENPVYGTAGKPVAVVGDLVCINSCGEWEICTIPDGTYGYELAVEVKADHLTDGYDYVTRASPPGRALHAQ